MALQSLLTRFLPPPPDKAPGRDQLLEEAMKLPLFAPIRVFVVSLQDMRPWWPVLLPLMLWVGWRTYRAERAAIKRQA